MKKTSKQQQEKPAVLRLNFSAGVRLLLLAVLVSACATTPTSKTDIKQRAQGRWDAVMAGDYDTAYTFYSPGYRSATSRVDFEIALRVRRVRWISAEVQESSCDADVCKVVTTVGYAVAGAVPGVSVWKNKKNIEESWVRTGGQWWYLPEDH
jgi:hypothetical protein